MKRLLLAAMVTAAALAGGPSAAAPAKKAVAARDWTKTVVATPQGGFRMGNPAAKVKLVEYGSLTCPHCADFSGSAAGPLAAMVRSGKLSFEFRNYVLNGADVTASLIARCGGPGKFFPTIERMYAAQPRWLAKLEAMTPAQEKSLQSLSSAERLARIADMAGLTQIGAASGIAPQQAKKCLADDAALQRLADMYEAASALGVEGTPTFLINGTKVHAHDWKELEPLIRKAGG
ncbi:MAG TPA: thioredoxin domain-containing protein [Allosphingosinicella sp.]|nr:thioredoxin domain-containing protein [Allosphingosinicella sp.]